MERDDTWKLHSRLLENSRQRRFGIFDVDARGSTDMRNCDGACYRGASDDAVGMGDWACIKLKPSQFVTILGGRKLYRDYPNGGPKLRICFRIGHSAERDDVAGLVTTKWGFDGQRAGFRGGDYINCRFRMGPRDMDHCGNRLYREDLHSFN